MKSTFCIPKIPKILRHTCHCISPLFQHTRADYDSGECPQAVYTSSKHSADSWPEDRVLPSLWVKGGAWTVDADHPTGRAWPQDLGLLLWLHHPSALKQVLRQFAIYGVPLPSRLPPEAPPTKGCGLTTATFWWTCRDTTVGLPCTMCSAIYVLYSVYQYVHDVTIISTILYIVELILG